MRARDGTLCALVHSHAHAHLRRQVISLKTESQELTLQGWW